ncbi:MAG: hypothetical protein WCT27_01880 [Patescibacteria group bacterium]
MTNTSVAANMQASGNTNTASTNSVSVTNNGFSPSTKKISLGQPVSWINNSLSTVYVTPDNHPTHTKYTGIWDDTGAG